MSLVVFGGVFGVAALLWIMWPLVARNRTPERHRPEGVRDDVAERTLLLYQELEEIDLEHEQGDLTAEEYSSLREAQKQRVLALLQARQREADSLNAAKDLGDTDALSDAIEAEVLRIRAQRRGEQAVTADQPAAADAPALAPARGLHWLWIGVPALLVLIAFGAIFQLYRASARTLTEQTPIAQVNASALVGLAFIAPEHVLLANASGLLESRDGGRTWEQASLDVAPVAMAVSPAGGIAYVFAADSAHVTSDAGRTWQAGAGTLPGTEVLAAAVNPYLPAEVYVSFADAGLQRSRDGGKTWERVATPDDEAIVAILVGGVPPLLFIAVESGRVLASSDEGETWAAASGAVTMALRGPVRALAGAPDGSVLYAAAHTGLYLSSSDGQTWVDLPLRKTLAGVAVDPATARTVLAVTETGAVYRSTDGGIAWRNEQ